tara:strand:+ start:3251 stop:3619 length:369 start_codon:yes stop_codon:yes gene_type:complete
MAVTISWYINQMVHVNADGGVVKASWSCVGKNDSGPETSGQQGDTVFEYNASSPDFTPYADLTQDQVLQWVWGAMDTGTKDQIQTMVTQRVNDKIQANATESTGLPWDQVVEGTPSEGGGVD